MRDDAQAPADLVVCLPQVLFHDWYDDGGTPEWPNTEEYEWWVSRWPTRPLEPKSSRIYVVSAGRLRGYALYERAEPLPGGGWALIRRGDTAEAITVPESIG